MIIVWCSVAALPQINEQGIGFIGFALVLPVLFGRAGLVCGSICRGNGALGLFALCEIGVVVFQTAIDRFHQLIHLVFCSIACCIKLMAFLLLLAAVGLKLAQLLGQDFVVIIALVEQPPCFACCAVQPCVERSGRVGIEPKSCQIPVGLALPFLKIGQGSRRAFDPFAEFGLFAFEIGEGLFNRANGLPSGQHDVTSGTADGLVSATMS